MKPERNYKTDIQYKEEIYMKKTAAAIIAAALVITLGGTTAFAFNRAGQSDSQNTVDRAAGMGYNQYNECTYCGETGHCYTDSDGDGICDHRASHTTDAGTCYKYIHSTSDTGCPGGSAYHCDGTGHHAGHRYGHR